MAARCAFRPVRPYRLIGNLFPMRHGMSCCEIRSAFQCEPIESVVFRYSSLHPEQSSRLHCNRASPSCRNDKKLFARHMLGCDRLQATSHRLGNKPCSTLRQQLLMQHCSACRCKQVKRMMCTRIISRLHLRLPSSGRFCRIGAEIGAS